MVLVDARRRQVDANGAYLKLLGYTRAGGHRHAGVAFVADGPLNTPAGVVRHDGDRPVHRGDGPGVRERHRVSVQWGASVEVVTGTRLVLFVVLSTSRWGRRFRRAVPHRSRSHGR